MEVTRTEEFTTITRLGVVPVRSTVWLPSSVALMLLKTLPILAKKFLIFVGRLQNVCCKSELENMFVL